MVKRAAFVGSDHESFSALRKNVFAFYPRISWLEFENGFEIILYCLTHKELPEIVFTEMLLSKIDGIVLTDYLNTCFPDMTVVCVVDEPEADLISYIAEVGAAGLVNKSDFGKFYKIIYENSNACHLAESGLKNIISENDKLNFPLLHYRNTVCKRYGITNRESLFLLFNATGLEYSEIALLMFVSKKTVDNLFYSVARKIGVDNRHNLTLFCMRMKLIRFSTVKAPTIKMPIII